MESKDRAPGQAEAPLLPAPGFPGIEAMRLGQPWMADELLICLNQVLH